MSQVWSSKTSKSDAFWSLPSVASSLTGTKPLVVGVSPKEGDFPSSFPFELGLFGKTLGDIRAKDECWVPFLEA